MDREEDRANFLYKLILENIKEGVAICDERNVIVDCNKSLSLITGYPREEIVGKNLADFMYRLTPRERRDKGFLERMQKRFDAYQRTGEWRMPNKVHKTTILTSEGKRRQIQVYHESMKTEKGYVIVAFANDVTELWEKDRRISRMNGLYKNIFENANDAIFIMKGERFVDCNSKTLSIFGIREKREIFDISPWNLSPKYQPDGMLSSTKAKEMIDMALSGIPQRFYWQHLRKDGTPIDTEVTLSLIDREEKIILAIVRDLTFQRNTADQLRKLYLMVEQSPVSIILTDLDGNIVYVNPWFTKMTGYEFDEVKGKNPRILKSGETSEEEYKKLWETITSGKVWRGEFHNVKKNGELYWESAIIAPVKDVSGKIVNYIGIMEDITELKKLQEQLTRAQRMEAIGTLTTGIAHDFNNILTAINGYVELIKLSIGEDNPIYPDILAIEESSNRASNLIKQLLAFSRRQVIEPKLVNVNEVIEGLCNLLSRMIGEDIKLKKNLSGEISPIMADPSQIEQIVINLIVNARDAIREKEFEGTEKGCISLETRIFEVTDDYVANHPGSRAGKFVMFSVSDNGIGMTEKVKKRIFDPFFTTKPRGRGTGMGLSTVYGIVKQNKGFIYVYSERGKGTTIKVYWPITEEKYFPVRERVIDGGLARNESGNVMIVEDDRLILDFTTKALKKIGYNVVGVSNGRDALDLINNGKFFPDVIISDVVMPEMGGIELYKELRNRSVRGRIKFLFTSGYSEQQFVDEFVKDKSVSFMEKPYSITGLVTGIKKLLDEV